MRALLPAGLAILLVACGGSGSSTDPLDELELLGATPSGASSANQNLRDLINSLPYEDLSDAELAAISFMREEEKLARDVYMGLYDIWGLQIFDNISESEQTHMDAILILIEKYQLEDPAAGALRGEFSDANLQGLHDSLLALGTASQIDALIVGATIEDLDIFDLTQNLVVVDNEDITVVFESLLKGSRNHLRAFHGRLVDMNITYTPVYISQEEYDEIVNSPMERGG